MGKVRDVLLPLHDRDLEVLRRSGYLAEMRPLLVGVDGGADALLEMGFTPDVIIGDFDSARSGSVRVAQAGLLSLRAP